MGGQAPTAPRAYGSMVCVLGLILMATLLDALLIDPQAEEPEPPADPELEALLPF